MLQALTFLGELARCRNGDQLDSGGREGFLGLRRMHTSITSHQPGWAAKDLPMMLDRRGGLPMLVGLLQNLLARHDAPIHLIEDHMPPKLDLSPALVTGNSAGVWLKEAQHLV